MNKASEQYALLFAERERLMLEEENTRENIKAIQAEIVRINFALLKAEGFNND